MRRAKVYIGVDIGKTKIAAGLVRDGAVMQKSTIKTAYREGFDKVYEQTTNTVSKLVERAGRYGELSGIGIAMFGIVDSARGLLVASSLTTERRNIKLQAMFEERFGKTVILSNDVSAEAIGEHFYGAGKGVDNSVFVAIGTGMGTGIVINNRPFHGSHMLAGQTGWAGFLDTSRTWEDYTSGSGIARRAAKLIGTGVSAQKVFEYEARGDPRAAAIVDDAVRHAATHLVMLQRTLDPEVIVLGGGVISRQHAYFERIVNEASGLNGLYRAVAADTIRIKRAELGEKAGLVGATKYVELSLVGNI